MYYRVQRGMVFWFNPDKAYGTSGAFSAPDGRMYSTSVIRGPRPYVVVGCNGTSRLCTVAAITSADRGDFTYAVKIDLPSSKFELSFVVVDQLRTVDIKALGDYICILSEEDMQRVNAALAEHLNISSEPVLVDSVVKRLEDTVSRIISSKMEAQKAVISDEDIDNAALRLGVALEDLFLPESIAPKSPPPVETTEHSKKRGKVWTIEQCSAFLKEYEECTVEEMRAKWGFQTKQAVYSAACRCRKRLQKGQQDENI